MVRVFIKPMIVMTVDVYGYIVGLYRDPITFLIATGTLLLVGNCAVSYGKPLVFQMSFWYLLF